MNFTYTFIFSRASSLLIVSVDLHMLAQCQKCEMTWSDQAWIFSLFFRWPTFMQTKRLCKIRFYKLKKEIEIIP